MYHFNLVESFDKYDYLSTIDGVFNENFIRPCWMKVTWLQAIQRRQVYSVDYLGTPIAFIVVRNSRSSVEITKFAVKAQHQGKGVLGLMIRNLYLEANGRPLEMILTEDEALDDNAKLATKFRRMGFVALPPAIENYPFEGNRGYKFQLKEYQHEYEREHERPAKPRNSKPVYSKPRKTR